MPALVPSLLAERPAAPPTAQLHRRSRRTALAIATLLLACGVVAFAAVPVFDDTPTPASAPARCQFCQVADPPAPVETALYDRSLSIPSSSDTASAPRTPPTPAAAERAFRAADRAHDWAAASAACADLLGHTSSRRLRAACAIASCRAGDQGQRDAFVDGLSRSRQAAVARACAR